nr:hypothetical protein BaRGS_026355 [Batillaria attramentaria]
MTRQNVGNLLMVNLISLLLSAGGGLYGPCVYQYVYRRIAYDLQLISHTNGTEPLWHPCNKSSHKDSSEDEAQKRSAHLLMQFSLLTTIPALFVNAFLGAYSDFIGRRFLFTVTVVGYVCQYGSAAVVSFLQLDLRWLFLGHVLNGCCGSFYSFLLAINAYNADNTPPSSTRTLGMALIGAGGAVGTAGGVLASGYFIEGTGFSYPLLTATILACLVLILELLFLAETRPREPGRRCPSPAHALKDVFGFYFLKAASSESDKAKVVIEEDFPRRQGSAGQDEHVDLNHLVNHPPTQIDRRPEYRLGIAVFFLGLVPQLGGIDVLYVMNKPFCWRPKTIGNFNTIKQVVQHFLAPVALKLMSRCMNDGSIGVVGMVSMGGGYLVMALAYTDWMVYLAPAVGFMTSLGTYSIRSLMSQRAPAGKQGSLFSGQAVVETLCGLTAGLLFNLVYSTTVDKYRGAAYLTMDGVTLMAIICMGPMENISTLKVPEDERKI